MVAKMTRAELVKRLAVKSSELGDPAKVLAEIGGTAAIDDLVDLLRNEPEPPDLKGFAFRHNLIELLGASGEERVIGPLLECSDLYRAWEDLIVSALESVGESVPSRYELEELVRLIRTSKGYSLPESPEYPRYKEKIDRGHLRGFPFDRISEGLFAQAGDVRREVVKALEQIPGEAKREALTYLLDHERNKWNRVVVAAALGRLGDSRGIEDLGKHLESIAENVGRSAIMNIWLGAGGGKSTVDVLRMLEDPRARQFLESFLRKCPDHPAAADLKSYAARRLAEVKPEVTSPAAKEPASGCFIATAACGSADAPEVARLRRFREQRLRPHRAGRTAIRVYERFSPPLAEFIRPRPWLRVGVRFLVLKPALFVLAYPAERQSSVESAGSD